MAAPMIPPTAAFDFLARHGWLDAQILPLAGDASFRRYFRIHAGERSAVLMDAPPPHEDPRPFAAIATWLQEIGLAAPRVLAADFEQGLLYDQCFAGENVSLSTNQPMEGAQQLTTGPLNANKSAFYVTPFLMMQAGGFVRFKHRNDSPSDGNGTLFVDLLDPTGSTAATKSPHAARCTVSRTAAGISRRSSQNDTSISTMNAIHSAAGRLGAMMASASWAPACSPSPPVRGRGESWSERGLGWSRTRAERLPRASHQTANSAAANAVSGAHAAGCTMTSAVMRCANDTTARFARAPARA